MSKEEWAKLIEESSLPGSALVAFAARCARRVQPLFRPETEDTNRSLLTAVENAIGAAERFAGGGGSISGDKAYSLASAANRFIPASNAAYAVYSAVYASQEELIAAVAACAHAAEERAASTTLTDFRQLKDAAGREQWAEHTHVPPEFFGPLWPDGEPDWYKKGIKVQQQLSRRKKANPTETEEVGMALSASAVGIVGSPPLLRIVWDPAVVTPEEYSQLVEALGDVVRANGGLGLKRIHAQGFGVPAGKAVPQ